ncbi:lysozyme-like domain-containing protein [Pilaira anomala]|nr:lysozyme-like domain-containing protein [Pilaira anomala]
MASLITNVFEDGDANFAYASCSNIQDMRGFTSGYAGFTTGTGDAETLIESFTAKRPNNTLAPYLPQIHQISQLPHCDRKNRGNTTGLNGYCEAWLHEACDEKSGFSELQKEWVYKNYMIPSARYAAQSGVYSPLGQAIFYDVIIQHGYQYVEPDINIVRILTLTGPRRKNESEKSFLKRFLTTRRELQCCYPDDVWPASATRSQDLLSLVHNFEHNKYLNVSITLKNFGRTITGKENSKRDAKRCSK